VETGHGGKGRDLTKFREVAVCSKSFDTLYYNAEIHHAALAIPGAPEKGYAIDARFGVASWQKGDDAQQLLQRGYNAVAR